jgi:Dyp-type peroxidase family
MSRRRASISKEAKAVLDVIADYKPSLPRNVALPGSGAGVLGRSTRSARTTPAAVPTEAPAPPLREFPPEGLYDTLVRRNIQGNIIPGFNKDHQYFFFYRITDVLPAKTFLRALSSSITSMDEVLEFVRAHRALRLKLGVTEPPGLKATWVNIAFSCAGIEKLGAGTGEQFGEQSFRQGLAERSTYLGDPTDPSHPGHRTKWRVGGPHNEADMVVIAASDTTAGLDRKVASIRKSAYAARLDPIFEQRCDTLPGNLRGHEHFGFKDGISQPGIRGKTSENPREFITPRYLVPDPEIEGDQHPLIFAKPGQPLVWPGQFLLGEPRQRPNHPFEEHSAATNFPTWAARGSYLVCRRLNQDVPAFWNFVAQAAKHASVQAAVLAASLVGRWPSGAPVMRTPVSDDPALAGDPFANNHFVFDDDTTRSSLRAIDGYPGDTFAAAKADMFGAVCPHFAHIRKMNLRDGATDLGKFEDTLTRLILRRGIPFGPPIVGATRYSTKLLAQERGLMFVCYASSIEDQFEFLMRRWANSAIHPNAGGPDPIIGQRDQRGDRTRFINMPTASGPVQLPIKAEWVTPTGGGYFFAPPIAALTSVLGA